MAGIAALSTYFPSEYQTSREIAEATGIPEDVIELKFGLQGKHIAAAGEHVSGMSANAARPLLERVSPDEVGALIYFGSAHKDFYLWPVAPKIAHALGLPRAFTFELMDTSSCGPIALRVARDMLAADPALDSILLVGASRESYVINYRNQRSRSAFNFGDGAAAALIRADGGHEILATAAITDGSFSDEEMVPAGGSVHPPSVETIEREMHHLDIIDPENLKQRLDPVSLDRFVAVVRMAVEKSGQRIEDIDFLAPLHTKRSLFEALLKALGLEESQSFYLRDYGHMSAIDPFVVLREAEQREMVHPGNLVVALSAGTGYSWAATAIRW